MKWNLAKWASTGLASVLLVTSLAACSSNKNDNNTASNGVSPTASASASGSGETAANQPYKDNIDISFISRDIYSGNGAISKDDKVIGFLNEKFNVNLKLNYVPSPNQNEIYTKLNSMIASNDIPDIMEARIDDLGGQVYRNLAKSGQLIDVEQFIKDHSGKYPNLEARISDPDANTYRAPDGKLYSIPRFFGTWNHAWYIRQDWLDQLGLQMPTTLDELHNVLKVFVEKDPDGKKNTGLTLPNAWWLNHIYAGFTGGFNWTKKDEQYVYNFNRPEVKDALTYVHNLYAEGLLDKEFFTHKPERDEIAKFTSGRVGVLPIGADFYGKIYGQLKAFNSKAEISFMPVDMKGPGGVARISGTKFFEGIMINKDTKDPERIFDLLEYSLSEEGKDLFSYGVKDVHYTVDASGNKVSNEAQFKKEGWAFGSRHPFMSATLDASAVLTDEALKDLDDKSKEKVRNFFTDLNNPDLAIAKDQLSGVQINAMKDVGSKPYDTFSKYEIGFITGDVDINAKWDELQQTLLKQGFQAAMDEVNKK